MGRGNPPLFCAPASQPFTIAHVLTSTNQSHLGMMETRCGLATGDPAEAWQPVGLLARDRVCPACAPDHPQAAPPAEQGALL